MGQEILRGWPVSRAWWIGLCFVVGRVSGCELYPRLLLTTAAPTINTSYWNIINAVHEKGETEPESGESIESGRLISQSHAGGLPTKGLFPMEWKTATTEKDLKGPLVKFCERRRSRMWMLSSGRGSGLNDLSINKSVSYRLNLFFIGKLLRSGGRAVGAWTKDRGIWLESCFTQVIPTI